MKKAITAIIILLIIIGGVYAVKQTGNKVQYLSETVERRTITETVEATGTINPVNTVEIGSQVSGQISEIFVDYNSEVKKGQLLARIDTSLFEAQLQQSLASINNARASLEQNLAILEYDEKTYNRYQNLYKRNLISKDQLDSAKSAYKSDSAKVSAAKASVMQAKANYDTASANLRYTKIISPVDGIVISKEVEVGQTVAASFQTPTLFTVAEDLTKMRIETSVSEADIGKVKEGQEVDYTIDGYPDDTLKGVVRQVRLSPTTESNVVTYTVIIDVENNEGKLMPGMTANVSIITNKKSDIITVPNQALKFTTADNKQKFENRGVWIEKNGKPQRENVTTGSSNDLYTEITSENIKEGDKVYVGVKTDKKDVKGNSMRPNGMPPRM